MRDKTFVDGNVLLYAHNIDAAVKHQIARDVIEDLWPNRLGDGALRAANRSASTSVSPPPANGANAPFESIGFDPFSSPR